MRINVGTYNVFGMPWGSRHLRSILLWIFLQSGTEVMCLQEVWSKQQQQMIKEVCEESKQWTCYFPYSNIHRLGKLTNRFASGSGLCILVKNTIQVTEELEAHTFILSKGLDAYVRKGFMIVHCRKDGKDFQVVNTHFQSDMTEIPLWRIRYNETRLKQEKQLYHVVKNLSCPIVLGDFNTEEFMYFECLEKGHRWTYTETGERLDSCLRTYTHKHVFEKVASQYQYGVRYSDHIPVSFTIEIH